VRGITIEHVHVYNVRASRRNAIIVRQALATIIESNTVTPQSRDAFGLSHNYNRNVHVFRLQQPSMHLEGGEVDSVQALGVGISIL
jgi:hypothetical protein